MKKYMNRLYALLAVGIVAIGMSSCLKELTVPENENDNKLHDDPKRAELTLVKGTLNGNVFTPATGDANTQVVVFSDEGKGWKPSAGKQSHFKVENGGTDTRYELTIRYFDKAGKDITYQFVTNGQELIHQHFFVTREKRHNEALNITTNAISDKTPTLFDYKYLDTEPYNKSMKEGATFIGDSNSIGMHGAFNFLAKDTALRVEMRLMHARQSKFRDGKPSLFYKPTNAQVAGDSWDLVMTVPFVIGNAVIAPEEGPDTPSTPDVPSVEKGEGEADSIRLMLVLGHFHGTLFHQNSDNSQIKHMTAIQTISYKKTNGKWDFAPNSNKSFKVVGSSPTVQAAYGLWINYYKEGKEVTGTYVENGQDQLYQHFFVSKNVQPTEFGKKKDTDGDSEKMFRYVYMDTTPWDKTLAKDNAQLSGSTVTGQDAHKRTLFEAKNAIGMKGFFEFWEAFKQYDLEISLVHAVPNKFQKDGKVFHYFEAPTAETKERHTAIKLTAPIIVFWNELEGLDTDSSKYKDFDSLSESDKRIVRAVAMAYGISNEEAVRDLIEILEGSPIGGGDNGALWF